MVTVERGTGSGLLTAVASTAGLAAVGAVVAGLVGGAPAAWGVVVGAVTVVAVFALGMGITQTVATLSPALSLVVALLTYLLQLVTLVVVLAALERSTLLDTTLDRVWIGATVIVGTVMWSLALVRADLRGTRGAGHYHSPRGGGESVGDSTAGPDRGDAPPG